MSPTIINAPAPNLMARETEEFASVIDSSINETKSHASVAGLYDSGTGVDEYETEADDSEIQADDSETQADEYEIEADENDTDADDNGTKADEYVRYANKTLSPLDVELQKVDWKELELGVELGTGTQYSSSRSYR